MLKILSLKVFALGCLLICGSHVALSAGFDLEKYKLWPEPGRHLSHLIVMVNGQSQRVESDQTLHLVAGDVFSVTDAKLFDAAARIESVNVYGYSRMLNGRYMQDDRLAVIATNDLQAEYSVNGKGRDYAIIVGSSGKVHGLVRVVVDEPMVQYIELRVNGTPRTLYPNDIAPVIFKKSDKVKVERIASNVASDKGALSARFVDTGLSRQSQGRLFRLEILRRDRVIGSIPFRLTDD